MPSTNSKNRKKRQIKDESNDDDDEMVNNENNENLNPRDPAARSSKRSRPSNEEKKEDSEPLDDDFDPSTQNAHPEENEQDHDDINGPKIFRPINPVGKPAEAGIIKRVYVENFMCHRKLTIDLCRNVNFIHGQNGSG